MTIHRLGCENIIISQSCRLPLKLQNSPEEKFVIGLSFLKMLCVRHGLYSIVEVESEFELSQINSLGFEF